jgi:hypothetical protein
MVLKDILAISGSNGLFRFISKSRNGIIIEGLLDKKRVHSPSSARVSTLDDIAVYTSDRDIPLKEILQNIFKKENGGPTIDPKSDNDKLKKYFAEIVPEYDRDRVYVSDIKKIYIWYNILNSLQMIDLETDREVTGDSDKAEENTEKKAEE